MIGFGQTIIMDANFEQALINLGCDTGIPDGSVSTASIDTIIFLDVSSSSIANLTGIEDFTALTYFDCSYNQIVSLDLSNNHDLQSLDCSNNQLTTLNIRNGNNSSGLWSWPVYGIHFLNTSSNPNLYCIEVDDKNYSINNWNDPSDFIFDSQQYFHGTLAAWKNVGSINTAFSSETKDFIIDENNIMYVTYSSPGCIFKCDTNIGSNWVQIGDSADAIALDQNNDLHKIYLEKYEDPATSWNGAVWNTNKVAVKLMKYSGSVWSLTSVDTIHSTPILPGPKWYGVYKVEDFVIDGSGDCYVSLMVNDYNLQVWHDYSWINVRKYNGAWSELDSTRMLKNNYAFTNWANAWDNQFNLHTTLAIHPNTGNLLIAGQQGAYSGLQSNGFLYSNVDITSNIVKEYNGTTWNILGDSIPFSDFPHNPAGAHLAANTNGDIICAFTNDEHAYLDPYGLDTLMVYKYNAGSNSWDTLIGGNPTIDMVYVNSLSMDINSYGEPCFAYSGNGYPPYTTEPNKGMRMVIQYNNNSNEWNTINAPVGPVSLIGFSEDWEHPIIKCNTDNELFVNYYGKDMIGNGNFLNVITHNNIDSTLCNTGSTIIEEHNTNTTNKELLKITDLLGRETKGAKNQPLFYIYDDGTVEKRIVIE